MSWFTRLRNLVFVRSARTRATGVGDLQESRREIQRLRERIAALQGRVEAEKRRQRRLERRLARRKNPGPAQRPLTPHRQAFHLAGRTDEYRFANVVSYPKSGRTWFSTLYFHYARHFFHALDLEQQSLHMPDRNIVFQQFLAAHAQGGRFPVCVFSHLGFSSLKPFESRTGPWPDKARTVLKRPTVLIVRDPRDVVVSHYHHLQAVGGVLEPDLSPSEFIRGQWGIGRVVRFMNLWADALRSSHANLRLCTYESLKQDTAGAFAGAMAFLGAAIDHESTTRAVEESSFEQLRDRERASRAYQGLSLEPDAFRFRRGSVGRYAKELPEIDAAYLDQVVATDLDPVFTAYHRPSTGPESRTL